MVYNSHSMDEVAQIRDKIDLVEFISEYVSLKRAGRNFKAPCPFHSEKSPSFVVSPERQIWHCFGCAKGGDVYTFLMEYDRLEFPEALRTLAKRAGVELTSRDRNPGLASQKERLYEINNYAKEFYHWLLTKHANGKRALEYLQNRGVTQKIIETFMLGYSPHGNALSQYLIKKKKYSKEDVVAAGLAFEGKYETVDFFRGRLMFPLVDHRDNIVGFAGRTLNPEEKTSKYINTRETIIYHKGEQFYGLNVTKDAIRRTKQAIIVEGEFDVISCFEHGVANVVAVKGTALTEAQVALLGRFAEKVTFCFDGDKAGQEAIKRSLEVVEKKGLTPTVIEIPGGKDPDESLKTSPGQFKKAVDHDIGIYDYLYDKALSEVDITTIFGKEKFSDLMLPVVAKIQNAIIKEHYLKKISTAMDISYESIVRELGKVREPRRQPKQEPTQKAKRAKEELLEEYLLGLIIQSPTPKETLHQALKVFSGIMPKDKAYHKIMDHLLEHLEQTSEFNSVAFAGTLPKELVPQFDTGFLLALPSFSDPKQIAIEVTQTAQQLKKIFIHKRLKELSQEITQKENADDEEGAAPLKEQYSKLTSQLETA